MSWVGEYLLRVIAAALIISLTGSVVEKRGPIFSVLKFVTGIVLIAVILSPVRHLNFDGISGYLSGMRVSAESTILEGEDTAKSEIQSYISNQSIAYILDKASALELDISVDVTLSDDTPYSIQSVSISGNASPYAKQRLTQMLCEDLGVSQEAILWS